MTLEEMGLPSFTGMQKEIDELNEENARLREGLKKISEGDLSDPICQDKDFLFKIIKGHRKYAREALGAEGGK